MTKFVEKVKIPQDRFEMRLSGSGGQGMILASVILGEAIGSDHAKNITQTQSYGPEARGGASKADIVVSTNEIFYPKAMKLDLLLAMTQEALDTYLPNLKEDGILIIDETLVTDVPVKDYYAMPFTRIAREEAGHIMVANVVALGAIAAITGVVGHDELLEAVLHRAPRGTEEKNRKAVEIGYTRGLELKNTRTQKV